MAWEVKKLNKIGNIFSGNSINEKVKKEKYLNILEGKPYVATKDVSYDSVIDYDNGVKIPSSDSETFRIAHKNSILICAEGGSAGRKLAFITQDICFVNKLFALEPFDFMDPRYVFYFYHTSDFQEQFKSRMTGLIGGVSMGKFKEIDIPVPPLPIQKKIVEVLDSAFEKIAKAKENSEANLKNSKEVFESYLQKVFENKGEDWDLGEFEKFIEIKNGRSQKEVLSDNGEYPIMGSAGNVMGYATKYICEAGTTIIGRKGNISTPLFINEKFWNVDTAFGLYPKENNDSKFLFYLTQTINFEKMNKGTTIPSLVKSDLLKIKVAFPKSLEEQKQIVSKLDNLSEQTKQLESIYSQKLSSLEELKQSILQKAFKGELTEVSS